LDLDRTVELRNRAADSGGGNLEVGLTTTTEFGGIVIMATQNVVRLAPTAKTTTRKPRKASRSSAGLGAVILVLLGLSLSHLARGIVVVAGCEMLEGTAMAVGLDLLIVGLEIALVSTIATKAHKAVARFANPALFLAFAWSSGLNAFS
jgi:hypothetical protein